MKTTRGCSPVKFNADQVAQIGLKQIRNFSQLAGAKDGIKGTILPGACRLVVDGYPVGCTAA